MEITQTVNNKAQQQRCLEDFRVHIRYVFLPTLRCIAVCDTSSIGFICRAHMANFIWLRSGTGNGLCQLSEWPEVALFTAQEPKGLTLNSIIYQNLESLLHLMCLFSLTGVMATNHQRAAVQKKKSYFLVLFLRDSRVALLYSYNLDSRLNCTSWLCMICMCLIRTVCVYLIK